MVEDMNNSIVPAKALAQIQSKGSYCDKNEFDLRLAELNFEIIKASTGGDFEVSIHYFKTDEMANQVVKAIQLAGYKVKLEEGSLIISWETI